MPAYRRNRVGGGCYFFTVNLADRRSDLLIRRVDVLREAVRVVRARYPFQVDAWVVLPDHMHCLWTLPEGDCDFPLRWRGIKASFSHNVGQGEMRRTSLLRKREMGVWQRRYWEHTIRDDGDYAAHMDYIHFNPVKHGLVEHAGDWAFSTFSRCVQIGLYPRDWAMVEEGVVVAGERG